MASPPPGGPQTPQTPPTYPQYPPQQTYPPQYPPQQPYYAQPAAPPPKQSNTALIIVLVVVVVIVVAAVVAWYALTLMFAPVQNTQNVTMTGVSWTINYPGSTQYFGPSPLTTCSVCPLHETIYSPFTYTLTLTNSDSVAHNVTDITMSGFQFTLVSVTPNPSTSTPVSVPAGGSRTFTLSIQATPLTGSGILIGTITTT